VGDEPGCSVEFLVRRLVLAPEGFRWKVLGHAKKLL